MTDILKNPPAVILVNPQLGENIGTCARAMLNFGLTEMRIVDPRDGWPNEAAVGPASGAVAVLENAKVFDTLEEAVADLTFVLATTARTRDMAKTVMTPAHAAQKCRDVAHAGEKAGILFGRERWGLNNEEVSRADAIVSYPVNPDFASLNLAQAVLLFGYEWYSRLTEQPAEALPDNMSPPATKQEMEYLFDHLERELIASGFLSPVEKRPGMILNIRALFTRAGLRWHEVQTLRGIIKSLVRLGERRGRGEPDEQ